MRIQYTLKVYPAGLGRSVYRTITICGTDTLDQLCMAILNAFDFTAEHKHRADVLYIVAEAKEDASRMSKAIKQMSRDVFAGKQTKTTMDEILKMNKSFERSKEKASNRKRLRMALEMDF